MPTAIERAKRTERIADYVVLDAFATFFMTLVERHDSPFHEYEWLGLQGRMSRALVDDIFEELWPHGSFDEGDPADYKAASVESALTTARLYATAAGAGQHFARQAEFFIEIARAQAAALRESERGSDG